MKQSNINRREGMMIAATAAALVISGAPVSSALAKSANDIVACYGVNACRGQSDCKTGATDCRGLNSCKGRGFLRLKRSDCAKRGGKAGQLP